MRDLIERGAAIEIPFAGPAIAEVVRGHWDTASARAKAQAVAEVARQLVWTEYGSERMARQYAVLYRRVLDSAGQV